MPRPSQKVTQIPDRNREGHHLIATEGAINAAVAMVQQSIKLFGPAPQLKRALKELQPVADEIARRCAEFDEKQQRRHAPTLREIATGGASLAQMAPQQGKSDPERSQAVHTSIASRETR